MKNERLLQALGQVNEDFIEAATPKTSTKKLTRIIRKEIPLVKKDKYSWVKWGTLAACLCIIAGISMKTALFPGTDNAVSDSQIEAPQTIHPKDNSLEQVTNETKTQTANTEVLPTTKDNDTSISVNTNAGTVFDEGFPNWGLTLSVTNVTATGLTLVVTQSGGEPTGTLETGDPYRLIALVDGIWETVEELPLPEGVDARAWNSIAYLLPMEDSREFDINWEWMFGELPAGTYRLIKEFMDFRKTADYDTCDYWVEFEIQ